MKDAIGCWPRMFDVRCRLASHAVDDVAATADHALEQSGLAGNAQSRTIQAGQTVAIGVGSRGIANLPIIVSRVVEWVRRSDALPIIVPAMGSHGGATAAGQQAMLASMGIDEGSVGAPVHSTMETVQVGQTDDGLDVRFDRFASQCDHVIAINRIKPHTRLVGRYESGLIKMLMIGMGKHRGATLYHQAFGDYDYRLDRLVPIILPMILERMPITMGIGIVEDAWEQTGIIEAIRPSDLLTREPELLATARDWLPGLPFDRADLLIVDRIGKEISGTGMDTNVIGRKSHDKKPANDEYPKINEIYVRSLTPKTNGNATGIGIAEYAHRRAVDAMDIDATRINCITGQHVTAGAVPLTFGCDRDVVDAVVSQFGHRGAPLMKWLRIADTLSLSQVRCSEAYWDEAAEREDLEVLGQPQPITFDANGDFAAI